MHVPFSHSADHRYKEFSLNISPLMRLTARLASSQNVHLDAAMFLGVRLGQHADGMYNITDLSYCSRNNVPPEVHLGLGVIIA